MSDPNTPAPDSVSPATPEPLAPPHIKAWRRFLKLISPYWQEVHAGDIATIEAHFESTTKGFVATAKKLTSEAEAEAELNKI